MRWLLLLCLVVPLSLAVPARAAAAGGPFADVPLNHWSYDALQELAQKGLFTGYPDGTFSGRRALTRYEFAVAVQRMQQDVERSRADNWQPSRAEHSWKDALLRRTVLWRLGARRRLSELSLMVHLNSEFAAELRMLGSDPVQASGRLEALVLDPPPAVPARPADGAAGWKRGVELARTEWDNGRAILYNARLAEAGQWIDPDLGLPIDASAARTEPDTTELVEGHDNEVYHLILEHGLPASARRKWLEQILNPHQVFEDGSASTARLDAEHRNTATRRREVHIRAEVDRPSRLQALEVALDGRTLTLTPFSPEAGVYSVDLVIGPPTSDVLFLRYLERRADGIETVYQVLDLRNGKPLKTERSRVEE